MDFITQNLLGAVAAQAACTRRLGRWSILPGMLGGAMPDFDVFLRPLADPAAPYELHRHFTHALVFIPFGAILATLPWLLIPTLRRNWKWTFLAALIGCGTHGLLDNLTSYGTHLYWPFIADRTSWDTLSIIDPIVTLALLLGVLLSLFRRSTRAAAAGFGFVLLYIVFSAVQHGRGIGVQRMLAEERGDVIVHGRVSPTLGNSMLWRSIYIDDDGVVHADAIHLGTTALVRRGASIELLDRDALPATSDPARVTQAVDKLERFADGFIGALPYDDVGGVFVADLRFSYATDGFVPLWGVAVQPHRPEAPVIWTGPRRDPDVMRGLWDALVRPRENGFLPIED